jgi:hypothetical protein
LDRTQTPFYFLLSDGDHRMKKSVPQLTRSSIAGGETESQPPRQSRENA